MIHDRPQWRVDTIVGEVGAQFDNQLRTHLNALVETGWSVHRIERIRHARGEPWPMRETTVIATKGMGLVLGPNETRIYSPDATGF